MLPADSLLLRLLEAPASPAESYATTASIEARTDLLRAVSIYLNVARRVLEDYEKLDRVAERAMPTVPAPILAYLKELS